MKLLKLNVDYKVKYPEGSQPADINQAQAELSKGYIEYAVSSCHPKGLNGQLRRVYGRIQSKMELALTEKSFILNLEDDEIKFLKNVFEGESTLFPATIASYVNVLEDEIMAV